MLSSRPITALVLSVAAFTLLPVACSDSDSGTTGKRIHLRTEITAGNEAHAPFTNAKGWSVALSKIAISTGALYYFDGSSLSFHAPERWHFGIRTAFAHPGHYVAGNARGEMLTPASFDLRAGLQNLPDGNGVSGVARSARFTFASPATGAMASELGSHVLVLEGEATKGEARRLFRAEIDPADFPQSKAVIEGCPFTEKDMQSDGTVTVSIRLPLWFGQVEFDTVPESTERVVMPDVIARRELVRGIHTAAAYVFSYRTP